MTIRKRSKEETRSLTGMIDDLDELEIDMKLIRRTRGLVPPAWEGLEVTSPCEPKKVKMTIRLEREVLEWYRHLGFGYQNRMNQVLRAYMRAVLSKHVEQPGDRDWQNQPI